MINIKGKGSGERLFVNDIVGWVISSIRKHIYKFTIYKEKESFPKVSTKNDNFRWYWKGISDTTWPISGRD